MKAVGAEQLISLKQHPRGIRVMFAGEVLAESRQVLALKEGSYPPVLYIPRNDVHMEHFRKTSNATECPHKGRASYYSAIIGAKHSENAAWSYETPFDQMAVIKGHFAFYPNRVDTIEEFD